MLHGSDFVVCRLIAGEGIVLNVHLIVRGANLLHVQEMARLLKAGLQDEFDLIHRIVFDVGDSFSGQHIVVVHYYHINRSTGQIQDLSQFMELDWGLVLLLLDGVIVDRV